MFITDIKIKLNMLDWYDIEWFCVCMIFTNIIKQPQNFVFDLRHVKYFRGVIMSFFHFVSNSTRRLGTVRRYQKETLGIIRSEYIVDENFECEDITYMEFATCMLFYYIIKIIK